MKDDHSHDTMKFPGNSPTAVKFPDMSLFSRQVVNLQMT